MKSFSIPIYSKTGKKTSDAKLSISVENINNKGNVLHHSVRAILSNARVQIARTKTRAEVRGGGQKPWRQKGTGRARIGSIRAPHWTGGGVIFGPRNRNYKINIPKKVKSLAFNQAVLDKVMNDDLLVFSDTGIKNGKTAEGIKFINALGLDKKITIALDSKDNEIVGRSLRNIKNLKCVLAKDMNTVDVLWGNKLAIQKEAYEELKKRLGWS